MEPISPKYSWKRAAARSPDPLRAVSLVRRIWETLSPDQHEMLSEQALSNILWFTGASPGLTPFLLRHPQETLLELFARGGLHMEGIMEPESQLVRGFLETCAGITTQEHLAKEIARFRNINLVRLYAQEILGLRDCIDIWREWSQVASCCIQGALEGVRSLLGDGCVGIRLVVMGMGKLGGEELNFSSDVDLIFLYDKEPGVAEQAAKTVADRWARGVTAVLEQPTEEGPPFRVDLGLRPGGKDGALAITLEGAEFYYHSLASPWERWALVKAHPVAGELDLGMEFLKSIESFVYRTSLDYTGLEDIRQMKTRIEREAKWRTQQSLDVKMGQGGIRELEFLVQTLQIIHGGKRPELRVKDTPGALEALAKCGILSQEEAVSLGEAYRFLRQLEHRIQMVQLRQTHRLPSNEMELRRLAILMGYGDGKGVTGLLDDLREYQLLVARAFQNLLAQPQAQQAVNPKVEQILGGVEQEDVLECIQEAGFREPKTVRECLKRILSPRFAAARSPRARRTLHRILPPMLSMVLKAPLPDQTLFRLERFLEAMGTRAGYYSLLEERPKTLERLMEVLAHSALLSRWLSEHVDSLDALVSGHFDEPRRSLGELREEAGRLLEGMEDPEERLGRLRLFRAQEYLRIGVGDIWGILNPWEVGEELTKVATVYLESTLLEVMRNTAGRTGLQWLPMCIIGLGSLGGEELTYRSDLDLMFLYDEKTIWSPPDGSRPGEFLTKIAQRLISWMSMPMKQGPGWEVDARLRPSGTRGPLIVSLNAFKSYHEKMGRSWERQMLLKARPCGGDPECGQRAMGMIDAILLESPPADPNSMHQMRMRMQKERAMSSLGQRGIHLKLGAGGMADIEFLVQYHQWLRWSQSPLLRTPNTVKAMEQLEKIGALGAEEVALLRKAHAFLKGLENRLGLVLDYKATDQPVTAQELGALGTLEEVTWLPMEKAQENLDTLLIRIMEEVRKVYLRHLGPRAS